MSMPLRRLVPALTALAGCIAVTLGALPSPAQQPSPASFTGQILDVRNGYVFFTTGDAYKLIDAPRIASYETGRPTTVVPAPRLYARAIVDLATRQIIELDLSRKPLPNTALPNQTAFVTVKSSPLPNPELVPREVPVRGGPIPGVRITGKQVPVTFVVEVPPNTPANASIYVSTDVSNWDPRAIKLDKVDLTHFRTVQRFASGTKFNYKITRGTWNAVERGQNGLEPAPHPFFVNEVDAQAARTIVYGWSDERNGQPVPVTPDSIPTPFNPNPFPPGLTPPGANPKVYPPNPGGATPPPARPPNLPPNPPS